MAIRFFAITPNLLKKPRGPKGSKIMSKPRIHNVPSQILSQVPEDINKSLKETKQSAGCKLSKGCNKKITSLDELRMKYSN